MIRRITTAYGVEVEKSLRQWSLWAGAGLVFAGVAGGFWLAPVVQDGRGDYAYAAQATALALHTFGIFAILVFCAGLLSSELASGVIRTVLVRPIRREEYVAAKILAGMTYAFVLALLCAGAIWAVIYAIGDRTGVTFGGETLYSHSEMLRGYFQGMLIGLPPLAALCAWGVFASSTTRNPAAAVGIAVGGWLLIDAMKYPLGIDAYVFTSYFEQALQPYRDQIDGLNTPWWPMPLQALGVSAGSFVVFSAGAMLIMNRRNLSG